jgi:hypothetical protein
MTFETILGIICCTLVGLVVLLCGIYQRTNLRSREIWPQVIGTVRKAEVIRDTVPDCCGYFVSVRYDHSVNLNCRKWTEATKSCLRVLTNWPAKSSKLALTDLSLPPALH